MHEEPSKSALKREAQRLQKIGLQLTKLKPDVRARFALPDNLRHAIDVYISINSREGSRRQMQFIGKLMRKVDVTAIEAQLADFEGQSANARHVFHRLENWRDSLTHGTSALTQFIAEHPQVDRQTLRQLVKAATRSKPASGQPTSDAHKRAQRSLFKFLRTTLENGSRESGKDNDPTHSA